MKKLIIPSLPTTAAHWLGVANGFLNTNNHNLSRLFFFRFSLSKSHKTIWKKKFFFLVFFLLLLQQLKNLGLSCVATFVVFFSSLFNFVFSEDVLLSFGVQSLLLSVFFFKLFFYSLSQIWSSLDANKLTHYLKRKLQIFLTRKFFDRVCVRCLLRVNVSLPFDI